MKPCRMAMTIAYIYQPGNLEGVSSREECEQCTPSLRDLNFVNPLRGREDSRAVVTPDIVRGRSICTIASTARHMRKCDILS